MSLITIDINIRLATRLDVNQLIDLENKCFNTDRFSKNQFKYLVEKANGFVFIFENEKKIIGSIILLKRKNSKILRIYSIAVNPNYQGQGIAGKLLKQAEKIAIDYKMRILSLEVKTTNESAIRLYQKRGFNTISAKENYYNDGNTALVMQKEI